MGAFKKVLIYAGEHRRKMVLAVCLILLSVIAGIVPYLITYGIILRFVENSGITAGYILWSASGIAVSLLAQSFLYYKGLEASHQVAYDTLMGMRIRFADKMTKLPLGNITQKGTGSYKKNLVDDIDSVESLLAHMIPEGLPYVIAPVAVYLILFFLDWRLALLSMVSALIGMAVIYTMMKSGMKKMGAYYGSAEKMNSTIVEYVSGMEVIKIFNQTTASYENYVSSVQNYKKFTLDWFKESWTYMAVYGAVLPCTVLLLLPVGIAFYTAGTLSLSTFVFALLLSMSIGLPLVKLVEFIPLIPQLKYKITQLEKTFEGDELQTSDTGVAPASYDIVFENVTFAYDKKEVVKDVSFCARANTVTAIVGASGSGKSTLAKLLVHFWDVGAGAITIGGVNIKNISFEKLMGMISYVSQDNFLFNASIMENIRVGKPDASDEEVIRAAKLAMCHDFIVNTENGYNTGVGDSGDKLSGGERQRIAIARAILKDAPIIILDEATAFTDPENEDKIQEGLNQLIAGKTLIVIAHRLATIVEADNILLMDGGKLLTQGRHDELLEKSGHYKTLWDAHLQSVGWDISVKGGQHA